MEWEPEQYVNKQSYKVDGFYTNGDEEQQIISVYKLGANGIFAIKDLYRYCLPWHRTSVSTVSYKGPPHIMIVTTTSQWDSQSVLFPPLCNAWHYKWKYRDFRTLPWKM